MAPILHRFLGEAAPSRGFWKPDPPTELNTIFFYDYGQIATIIVTITKVFSILTGLYLIWTVHKKEKQRLLLPEWDQKSKKPYLLPIYHGFIYVMILLLVLEVVFLNLWEFNTHWSFIAVGELFLQSLICEGFVHPLTGSSVSVRSILTSMSVVLGFSIYGAVMGVFVALCAQNDSTYRYTFVLLAIYHFLPLFYHTYIVFPFSSSSNVTPKRLAIKSFSRWIFMYRFFWMMFNIVNFAAMVGDYDSPFAYYLTVSILSLFELPFAFVIVAMVRVDTVYWHSGAQNFLRTYTQQIALENKQFNQNGMSITTLDEKQKDRAFTAANVTKYLIENTFLADSDRILQCVPSVERELRRLVSNHIAQVNLQREALIQRQAELQRKEQEQAALYQAQLAFVNQQSQQLSNDHFGVGSDSDENGVVGTGGVGLGQSSGALERMNSNFGVISLPSMNSFGSFRIGATPDRSLVSSVRNINHFVPHDDDAHGNGGSGDGPRGSGGPSLTSNAASPFLPATLSPGFGPSSTRAASVLPKTTSNFSGLPSGAGISASLQASGAFHKTHLAAVQGSRSPPPGEQTAESLEEIDLGVDLPPVNLPDGLSAEADDMATQDYSRPVIKQSTKLNRRGQQLKAGGGEQAGSGSGSLEPLQADEIVDVMGFLEKVNKKQFPAEEIQLQAAFLSPSESSGSLGNLFFPNFQAPQQPDGADSSKQAVATGLLSGSSSIPMGAVPTGPVAAASANKASSRAKSTHFAQQGHQGNEQDGHHQDQLASSGFTVPVIHESEPLPDNPFSSSSTSTRQRDQQQLSSSLLDSSPNQDQHIDPLTHLSGLGSNDPTAASTVSSAIKSNHFGTATGAYEAHHNSSAYTANSTPLVNNTAVEIEDDFIMRNDPLSPAVARYAELYDDDNRMDSSESFARTPSFSEHRTTNRCSTCLVACFGPGVWDIVTCGLYTLFDSYRYSEREDLEEEEEQLAMMTPSLEAAMKSDKADDTRIEDVTDFNSAIAHPQLSLLNNADARTLDLLQQVIDSNSRSLIALNQLEIFSNKILGQGTFAFVFMGELSLRAAQQKIRKKIIFHNRSNKPRRFVGMFDVFLHSIARQFQKDPNTIVRQTLFQTGSPSSPGPGGGSASPKSPGGNSSKRVLLNDNQPEQYIHPTTPHINDKTDYGNLTSWTTRLLKAFFTSGSDADQNNDRLDLDLTKYLLKVHDVYSTQQMWQLQFMSYSILARSQVIVSMLPAVPVSNRLDHSPLAIPIAPQASLFERILLPNAGGVNPGPSSRSHDLNVGFSPFQLHCLFSLCTMLYLQQTVFNLYKTRLRPKRYRFDPSQLMTAGLRCTNNTPINKAIGSSTQFTAAQIYQLQQQEQLRASKIGSVGDSVKKIATFVLSVFDKYREIVPNERIAFQQLYQKPTLYKTLDMTYQTVINLENGPLQFEAPTLSPSTLAGITEDPLLKAASTQRQLSFNHGSHYDPDSFGRDSQHGGLQSHVSGTGSQFGTPNGSSPTQHLEPGSVHSTTSPSLIVPSVIPQSSLHSRHLPANWSDAAAAVPPGADHVDGFYFINLQQENTQRLISTFLHEHKQESKFPVQQLFAGASSVIAKIEHNRRKVSYINGLNSASAIMSASVNALKASKSSSNKNNGKSPDSTVLSPSHSQLHPSTNSHYSNAPSRRGDGGTTTWCVNESIFSNATQTSHVPPASPHSQNQYLSPSQSSFNGSTFPSFGPSPHNVSTDSNSINKTSESYVNANAGFDPFGSAINLGTTRSIPMGNTNASFMSTGVNLAHTDGASGDYVALGNEPGHGQFGSPRGKVGSPGSYLQHSDFSMASNPFSFERLSHRFGPHNHHATSFDNPGPGFSSTHALPRIDGFGGAFNPSSSNLSRMSSMSNASTVSNSPSILTAMGKSSSRNNATTHQDGRISLYDLEDENKHSAQAAANAGQQRVVDTVAVKFFKKTPDFSPASVIAIAKETNLHCKMKHPNIVYCYGILVAPPTLAVLTEICGRGDLFGLIEGQGSLRRRFLHLAELTQALLRTFQETMDRKNDGLIASTPDQPSSSTTLSTAVSSNQLETVRSYDSKSVLGFNQTIPLGTVSPTAAGFLSNHTDRGLGANVATTATKTDLIPLTSVASTSSLGHAEAETPAPGSSGSSDGALNLSAEPTNETTAPPQSNLSKQLSSNKGQQLGPLSEDSAAAPAASNPISPTATTPTSLSPAASLSGDAMRAAATVSSLSVKTVIRSLHFALRRMALISTQLWNLRTRLVFAIDAATAVAYCHSKHLLHRDIKSLNFFVNDDNMVKLADFGISKVLKERVSELDLEYRKLIFSHPALKRDNVSVEQITSLLNKPNFPQDDGPRLCLDHGTTVWHVDYSGAGRLVAQLQHAAKYITQLSRLYFQEHTNGKSVNDGQAPWVDRDSAYAEVDMGKLIAHTLLQRVEAWHIDSNLAPTTKFFEQAAARDDSAVVSAQPQLAQTAPHLPGDADEHEFLFTTATSAPSHKPSDRATAAVPSSRAAGRANSGLQTPSKGPASKIVKSGAGNTTPKLNFKRISSSSSLFSRSTSSLFDAALFLSQNDNQLKQRPTYEFPSPAVFMTQEQSHHGTINLNNVWEQPPSTVTPQRLRKMEAARLKLLAETYGSDATPATVLSGQVLLGPEPAPATVPASANSSTGLESSNTFTTLPPSASAVAPAPTPGASAPRALPGAKSVHSQTDFFYDPLAELLDIISFDGTNPVFGITSLSPNQEVMAQLDLSEAGAGALRDHTKRTYFSDIAEFSDFSFSFSPKRQAGGGAPPDEREMARVKMISESEGGSAGELIEPANASQQVSWSFFSEPARYGTGVAGSATGGLHHPGRSTTSVSKHTTNQGTAQWLAPEAFDSPSAEQIEIPQAEGGADGTSDEMMIETKSIIEYSYPVDVYALGLTLWEVLCIQPMDARDLTTPTLRFTRDIPFQLRLLLLSCIDQRPQLRPTAKQVVDVLTMHLYMLDFVATFINNSSMLKL